ncbi:DUF58 domain-containing protein [Corynebacterium sp. LK33]|uniref:DUF58 domain-containing protein n=1 Tax=Corynebacterium sp. LK33 TaxID=2044574 RepID=UPI001651E33A|nr:DUF58 domain-containing protein [Corynebacterium sp. LK33]MBC6820770.1 DUF58 domain-containing protein [Corynebacterium sp. LK33]
MSAREDDLARVLAYLDLTVTRKLNGLLRGSFLSTATGDGSEPVGSREYVIGDDVRQMNWAVTARTGVPHVRTSEAERELECWIVAEPAARLSTGLADTTKRHLLTAAAGAVTMLNDAPGSRTGLIAGGTPVPAGQGRAHSLMLLKQLADATAEHNLAADIDTVMTQAPRAGLLVVISDFLGSLDWARPLRVASASTEIMAIRLVDPADEALPGEGPVVMADSATGETIELNINDKTRAEYAAQARAHHERVINELRKCRARVITLRTDSDWVLDFARQIGQH